MGRRRCNKGHHWVAVVDETGTTLWSKKIDNDESAILTARDEILGLAGEVHWAVDSSGTSSALLLALLAAHGQHAVCVPGRTVNRMSGAYRGEAKTDARNAYVIASATACDVSSTCPHSPASSAKQPAHPPALIVPLSYPAKRPAIPSGPLRRGVLRKMIEARH
jgi:hypothetical protein